MLEHSSHFWEPCRWSITWDVIHRLVYLWPLINWAENLCNTLRPGASTHVTAKDLVASLGGRLRSRQPVLSWKPEEFSLLCRPFYNGTTIFETFDFDSLSSLWDIVDGVLQRNGGEVPIYDRPGDDENVPGTTLWSLHSKSLCNGKTIYQTNRRGIPI